MVAAEEGASRWRPIRRGGGKESRRGLNRVRRWRGDGASSRWGRTEAAAVAGAVRRVGDYVLRGTSAQLGEGRKPVEGDRTAAGRAAETRASDDGSPEGMMEMGRKVGIYPDGDGDGVDSVWSHGGAVREGEGDGRRVEASGTREAEAWLGSDGGEGRRSLREQRGRRGGFGRWSGRREATGTGDSGWGKGGAARVGDWEEGLGLGLCGFGKTEVFFNRFEKKSHGGRSFIKYEERERERERERGYRGLEKYFSLGRRRRGEKNFHSEEEEEGRRRREGGRKKIHIFFNQ